MRDPSDAEDKAQIQRFLSGDEGGFEILFDKYREKVYRVAHRFLRNKEDALEVTQEVFLRVFQSLAKFKTESKFFTWLYRITVNRCIDFSRSKKAKPTTAMEKSAIESVDTASAGRTPMDPVARAQEHELEAKLAEAVRRLSDNHRTVFLLHAKENLSYKEIAGVAECSIGTVMSRLFYARKKLQQHLEDLGVRAPGSSSKKE